MNFLKKNKWIVFLLIAIGGYSAYQYAYQPHKTTEELKTDFIGTSEELMQKIQNNFNAWNNKTVELSGKITAKDENGITLNHQVYCQFREDFSSEKLTENEQITLKGRVIGYDDLLNELKLNECIIQP